MWYLIVSMPDLCLLSYKGADETAWRIMLIWLSHNMRFPTMWYVWPAKPQISLRTRAVWSEPLLVTWIFYDCKALTEHHLEFLSLNGGCTGSSESTLRKTPYCWKSHVSAHICLDVCIQQRCLASRHIYCFIRNGGICIVWLWNPAT